MASQRHAQVRYLSSPRMGNYPLPRPGSHTHLRGRHAPETPRAGAAGARRTLNAGWAPTGSLGSLLRPPPTARLHRRGRPPSARPRSLGREPEAANGEGRSKGTRAKGWKRSRRGGDEDSQTSQKERAGAGAMRTSVWFDFVSFCHNISELRERAVIEHERQNEYPSFPGIKQRIAMEIILPQRTNIKGHSHRLTCGAP